MGFFMLDYRFSKEIVDKAFDLQYKVAVYHNHSLRILPEPSTTHIALYK